MRCDDTKLGGRTCRPPSEGELAERAFRCWIGAHHANTESKRPREYRLPAGDHARPINLTLRFSRKRRASARAASADLVSEVGAQQRVEVEVGLRTNFCQQGSVGGCLGEAVEEGSRG